METQTLGFLKITEHNRKTAQRNRHGWIRETGSSSPATPSQRYGARRGFVAMLRHVRVVVRPRIMVGRSPRLDAA